MGSESVGSDTGQQMARVYHCDRHRAVAAERMAVERMAAERMAAELPRVNLHAGATALREGRRSRATTKPATRGSRAAESGLGQRGYARLLDFPFPRAK